MATKRTRTYLEELLRVGTPNLRDVLRHCPEGRQIQGHSEQIGHVVVSRYELQIPPARITIEYQARNYGGGGQPYLLCPACGSRRMYMYRMSATRWVCRDCTSAHYRNNSLEPDARMERAISRIEAVLNKPRTPGARGKGKAQLEALKDRLHTLDTRRAAYLNECMIRALIRIDPRLRDELGRR